MLFGEISFCFDIVKRVHEMHGIISFYHNTFSIGMKMSNGINLCSMGTVLNNVGGVKGQPLLKL